jgi:molybdopterin-guanine dinucleotide biosynthesis protein A
MNQIEAFILAGGASRRMGTDKSRLTLEGQSFIERIANTLSKISLKVTVVGQDYNDLSFESIPDVYPKWGALGGVQTALATCRADWALVVACDLPFVTSELCERLVALRESHDAVVPIQQDSRPQPLCALYKREPCLAQAIQLIQEGHRRPLDLIERVNTRWVGFSELQDLSGAEKFFVNINTPEDYYAISRTGVVGDD